MKREIVKTGDGSTTIHLPDWEESYHSKHGAIQEAKHVFIKNGLSLFSEKSVSILEIGFGTGLNAFITYLESKMHSQTIDYVGLEAYPISKEEVLQMNYPETLDALSEKHIFEKMHQIDWEEKVQLSTHFSLTKRNMFFSDLQSDCEFDLIYFDAFGYRVQPELWSEAIFQKMFNALKSGGILVTYACRSPIKRAMVAVGFTIEKLAGPPGKREMLRATKP